MRVTNEQVNEDLTDHATLNERGEIVPCDCTHCGAGRDLLDARAAVKKSSPPEEVVAIVRDAYRKIMAQREEIIEAFIAKYGIEPDELLQVQRETPTGQTWSIERRAVGNEGT